MSRAGRSIPRSEYRRRRANGRTMVQYGGTVVCKVDIKLSLIVFLLFRLAVTGNWKLCDSIAFSTSAGWKPRNETAWYQHAGVLAFAR
jgi:hypothetical protein